MKKDGDSVDEDMVNNEIQNVETDGERSSVVGRGKPLRKGSVQCKLPLSRISGFVAPPRVMCLFCDRSFLSAVFLQKHTNRYHQVAYSRRSSTRNSDQINSASQNYHPGCSFCNSKSLTVQKSDDLSALFHHLLDMHSLKYFGCRFCQQRFLNSSQLKTHNQTIHPELQKTVDCDKDVISFSVQLTPNETGKEQTSSVSLRSSFEPIETDSFDLNPKVSTKRICLSTRSKSLTSVSNSDSKKELRSRKASNKSKKIKSINKNPQPTCSQEQIDKNPVEIKCHSIDPKRLPEPIVLIPSKEDLKLTRKTAFDKNGISESIDKKLGKLSRASVTLTPVKIKSTTNNDTQMLSRLGLAQNRSPRTQSLRRNRKTTTVDHRSSSELSSRREKSKGKNDNEFIINKNRIDPSAKFDPNFYSTVSKNVRENLLKYLDGKLEKCKVACDVPDVIDPKIRSTHAVLEGPVSKQPAEIHGSNLALNAITIFPTLLAPDQYGSDKVPHYSYGANSQGFKKTITKNSWKWKWDITKKLKPIHDVGRRDLSRLDIWTQLTMRERYDKDVFQISHSSEEGEEDVEKAERRKQVKELNAILDSRVLPDIQNELKLFGRDGVEIIEKPLDAMPEKTDDFKEEISEKKIETMALLGLTPNNYHTKEEPPVFSGEWQRPRCYVCCVCGIRADCLRLMEAHQASQHPYAQATYYELVGKEALDNQLYKHLYIPGSKRNLLNIHKKPVSPRKVFKLNQSTRILRTAARNIKSQERPCTKCNKLLLPQELHKHILECAGDYAWMMSKKKCKNKPFGVRRRRLKGLYKRERPQDEEQSVKDSAPRPKLPPRPRSKPSDVETIQRMLANLPPKRTSKQVLTIPSPKTRKILNNQSRILRRILPDSKIQRSTRIVRTIKDGKMRRVTRSVTNKKPAENKNIENNSNTQNEIMSKEIKDVVVKSKKESEKSEENNDVKNKKPSTGHDSAANSNDKCIPTGLESGESINDEGRSLRKRPKVTNHQPSLWKAKKCPQRQNVQTPSDVDNPENTNNTPNAEPSENEIKQNAKPSEINVPSKPKSGNNSKRKSKKVLGLPLKWIGKRTKITRFRKKKVDSNLSVQSGNENIGAENCVNNSVNEEKSTESEKKTDHLSSELLSSTENKRNEKTDDQSAVSMKINSESEIQNVQKLSLETSGNMLVMSNEKTVPVMTLSNDSHRNSNLGFSNHGNQSFNSGSSSSNDFRLYDSSVQGTSISGTENKTIQLGYNHNLGYYLPNSLQITSRNPSGEHFEQPSDMNKADDFAIDNIDKPPLFSSVIAQSHMKEIMSHEAPVSYAQSTKSQKQYSHNEANFELAHTSHLSKSKMSNKSKRGLNDCIAMLRGKLSEKSVEMEIIQSPTLTPNNTLITECSLSQDDESLQPLDLSGKCQAEDLSMSRHSEVPENLSIPKPKEDWQEVQDLSMKSAMKTTKSALLNVRKPVYDPTLRIPQFLTTSEQTVLRPPPVVNQTNYVMDASPTISVGKSNILHTPKPVPSSISHELALLPQTLVNTIEKLPPTQQEEIVKVLPQVLVKAVENYNLFRTDSINRQSEQDILKNISTSLSKPVESTNEFAPAKIHVQTLSLPQTSEISTQTSVLPKEEVQKCPPEYLNVNTDLFLIDPISGLISERKIDKIPNKIMDTTKVLPMKTRPHEIIDLTDDNISKEPEEVIPAAIIEKPKDSETNVRSVVIIDPSSIDKNKPIELNKMTKGTASLRAVRIKSTSEKMKIKNLVMTEKSEPLLQVLAQPTVSLTMVEERSLSVIKPIENVSLENEEKISVEQESTENAITSSKDMKAKNKELSDANISDINEAAAIQQDEVSSTQHSSVEDTSDIPGDIIIKSTLSPLQQKIADICNKDHLNQKEIISVHEPALSKNTDSGVNESSEIIANTPKDKYKSKVRKLNTRRKRNRTKKMKKVIQIIEPPTHKENSKEKDSNVIVDKRDKGEPKSNDLESDKKISFGNLLKECNSLSESAVTPSNAVDFHTERKVLEKCENIQMNEMMQEDVDVDRNISVRRSLRTKKTILKESMPPLEKDINIYQNRDSSNGIEPIPDLTGAIIPEDSYKANLGSNTEATDKETVSTIQELVQNKDESDDDDICLALFTKKSTISEKRAEVHVETTKEELSSNNEKVLQECSKPEISKETTKVEIKIKKSTTSSNNEKVLEGSSKTNLCDEKIKVEKKTKKSALSTNNEKILEESPQTCDKITKVERKTKKFAQSSNNEKALEESSKPSEEKTKTERKTKKSDPSSNNEKIIEESSKPSEEKTKVEKKTKKADTSPNNEKILEESSKPSDEKTKVEKKTKKAETSSNNEKILEECSKPSDEKPKVERRSKKSAISSGSEKILEECSKSSDEKTKVESKTKKSALSSNSEMILEETSEPTDEKAKVERRTKKSSLLSNDAKISAEGSKPSDEKTKVERKTKKSALPPNNEKILEESSASIDAKIEKKTKKADKSSNNEKILEECSKPSDEKPKVERRSKKSAISSGSEKILEECSKSSDEKTKVESKTKKSALSSNSEMILEETSEPCEENTKIENKTKKSALSSNTENILQECSKPCGEKSKVETKTKKSSPSANIEISEDNFKSCDKKTKAECKTKKSAPSSNNEKILKESSNRDEKTKIESKTKKSALSSNNENILEECSKSDVCDERTNLEIKIKKTALSSNNEKVSDESLKRELCDEKTKIENKIKKLTRKKKNLKAKSIERSSQCFDANPSDKPLSSECDVHNSLEKNTQQDFNSFLSLPEPKKDLRKSGRLKSQKESFASIDSVELSENGHLIFKMHKEPKQPEENLLIDSDVSGIPHVEAANPVPDLQEVNVKLKTRKSKKNKGEAEIEDEKKSNASSPVITEKATKESYSDFHQDNNKKILTADALSTVSNDNIVSEKHHTSNVTNEILKTIESTEVKDGEEEENNTPLIALKNELVINKPEPYFSLNKSKIQKKNRSAKTQIMDEITESSTTQKDIGDDKSDVKDNYKDVSNSSDEDVLLCKLVPKKKLKKLKSRTSPRKSDLTKNSLIPDSDQNDSLFSVETETDSSLNQEVKKTAIRSKTKTKIVSEISVQPCEIQQNEKCHNEDDLEYNSKGMDVRRNLRNLPKVVKPLIFEETLKDKTIINDAAEENVKLNELTVSKSLRKSVNKLINESLLETPTKEVISENFADDSIIPQRISTSLGRQKGKLKNVLCDKDSSAIKSNQDEIETSLINDNIKNISINKVVEKSASKEIISPKRLKKLLVKGDENVDTMKDVLNKTKTSSIELSSSSTSDNLIISNPKDSSTPRRSVKKSLMTIELETIEKIGRRVGRKNNVSTKTSLDETPIPLSPLASNSSVENISSDELQNKLINIVSSSEVLRSPRKTTKRLPLPEVDPKDSLRRKVNLMENSNEIETSAADCEDTVLRKKKSKLELNLAQNDGEKFTVDKTFAKDISDTPLNDTLVAPSNRQSKKKSTVDKKSSQTTKECENITQVLETSIPDELPAVSRKVSPRKSKKISEKLDPEMKPISKSNSNVDKDIPANKLLKDVDLGVAQIAEEPASSLVKDSTPKNNNQELVSSSVVLEDFDSKSFRRKSSRITVTTQKHSHLEDDVPEILSPPTEPSIEEPLADSVSNTQLDNSKSIEIRASRLSSRSKQEKSPINEELDTVTKELSHLTKEKVKTGKVLTTSQYECSSLDTIHGTTPSKFESVVEKKYLQPVVFDVTPCNKISKSDKKAKKNLKITLMKNLSKVHEAKKCLVSLKELNVPKTKKGFKKSLATDILANDLTEVIETSIDSKIAHRGHNLEKKRENLESNRSMPNTGAGALCNPDLIELSNVSSDEVTQNVKTAKKKSFVESLGRTSSRKQQIVHVDVHVPNDEPIVTTKLLENDLNTTNKEKNKVTSKTKQSDICNDLSSEINNSVSMSNISVLEEDLSDKTDSSTCLANLMNSQKKPKRKKNKFDKTSEKSGRRLKKNIKISDRSDDSLSDSDSLIKLKSNKFKSGVKRKKKSGILQKDIPVESPFTAVEEGLTTRVGDQPEKINISQTNDDMLDNNVLPLDSESMQDKFLADFGMYTEKRPRKSTLLAMKKISKTFKPDTEDNWDENKSEDGTKQKKITKKVKKSLTSNDTKIDPIYEDRNKHNEGKTREDLSLNIDHFTFHDEIDTSIEKSFSQKFRDKSFIKENVNQSKTMDTCKTPPHDQFIQKSPKNKTLQSSERTLFVKSTNSKSVDKDRKKEKSVGDLKKEISHKNKVSGIQMNKEEITVADNKSSEQLSDSNLGNDSSNIQIDHNSKSDSFDDKEFSSNTADENRNIDTIFPKKADEIYEKKTRIPSDNYCLLCKKKFRRHENLLKHQMTLMHISRVSEVEAKERENQVESSNVNKIASADPKTAPSNSRGHKNLAERKSFDTNIKISTEIQPVTQSPLNENVQISSDFEKPAIEISTDSSRKTLSTDEALFFECCSLLKESNDLPISTTVDPVPESYPLTSEQNNSSSDSTPYTSGVKNILKASKLMPPSLTGESDNTMELSQTDSNSDIHPTATEERVFSFVANSATEENKDDARNNFKHFLDSEMIFTSTKETEELNKKTENNSPELHKTCSGDYDPYSAESLMVRTNSDDFSDNGDSIVSSHDTENTSTQNITKSLVIPSSVKAFSQPVLMNEFEDKFDKIKRKAREKAQAAQEAMAAVIAPPRSHSKKSSKKSSSKSRKLGGEKKSHQVKLQKSKNKSKRRSMSTLANEKTGSKKVLTKAALKGFDSVKVSINSEELNFRDVLDSKQINSDKDLGSDYEPKIDKFANETTEKKFNLTPKSVSTFGKMNKEKSQSIHKFEEKDSTINSEKHDIYEFMDDEEDNMSDSFKFRTPTVVNRTGISKKGETPLTTASCSKSLIDVQNDDSQISSLSFSDRDDFTYMSDDYNGPDSGDETNHSSNSLEGTPLLNKNSKKHRKTCKFRNTKKNAIMGKIFKNVIKSNEQSPENDGTDNIETAVSSHTDMDQLFDSLLDRTVSENNQNEEFNKISADATDTDDMYSAGDEPRLEEKAESNPRSESDSDNDERNHIPVFPRTSQRKIVPRLKARSSDDETISPPKHSSMHHGKKTEIGVASHKSQRKCTTGKQNVLVESWSSESDYEDFRQFEEYSSIPRSQKHHRRPRRSGRHRQIEQLKVDRSESLDSSKKSVENFSIMEEEPKLNYTSGKNSDTSVCNVPIDSKEDYNNLNLSSRRAVSFTPNISFKNKGSKRKRRQSHKPFDYDDEFKPTRIAEPSTTQRRNKRPASEMLYYWSSSSDDDEKNVSNDLSGRESEPVEQHGWIVGDSHKKLVTMLAHAKGRKVDDNSSVKEKKCRPS